MDRPDKGPPLQMEGWGPQPRLPQRRRQGSSLQGPLGHHPYPALRPQVQRELPTAPRVRVCGTYSVWIGVCWGCVCVCTRTLSTRKCMIRCSQGMCVARWTTCAFSGWGRTCHCMPCQWVHVCMPVAEGVYVWNPREGVCLDPCSHLHLGEDRCKYVCDSLRVCISE